MSEPQTQAGRALVERSQRERWMYSTLYPAVDFPEAIAAIEVEAVADFVDTMPIELQETIIRDWLASGDAERRLAMAFEAAGLSPRLDAFHAILAALRADDE